MVDCGPVELHTAPRGLIWLAIGYYSGAIYYTPFLTIVSQYGVSALDVSSVLGICDTAPLGIGRGRATRKLGKFYKTKKAEHP